MKQYVNFIEKDHSQFFETALEEIVRTPTRKTLRKALEHEFDGLLRRYSTIKTADFQRAIVRNGHLPERAVQTGAGSLLIKQPRVRDRQCLTKFDSSILPPSMTILQSIGCTFAQQIPLSPPLQQYIIECARQRVLGQE